MKNATWTNCVPNKAYGDNLHTVLKVLIKTKVSGIFIPFVKFCSDLTVQHLTYESHVKQTHLSCHSYPVNGDSIGLDPSKKLRYLGIKQLDTSFFQQQKQTNNEENINNN